LVRNSRFHGTDGHRDVAVAGQEDDRNVDVRLGQLGLKIEPARALQPDIEHHAARDIRQIAFQELGRARECPGLQADRPKKSREGVADGLVVVDDVDDRRALGRRAHHRLLGRTR
jgi:hypothetical protein